MKIVIAGGPYSGKTTLINELKKEGFDVIPEAAKLVIDSEQAEGNLEPWQDRDEFQKKILKLQIEQASSLCKVPTFFDRGIPDSVAYYYLDNLSPPSFLLDSANDHRYDFVFIPELLPEYDPGITRGESLEEREKVHGFIKKSYSDAGYKFVSVPCFGDVSERIEFIKDKLKNLQVRFK